MSNVYLHDPAEVDFSTTGYGALPLSECTFTEEKNGRSMLSGTVVMTEDGAVWGKLELGSVIDAKVPMRENPVKGRIPTGSGKTITLYTVLSTTSGKKLNLHVEPNQNSRVIKAYPAGTRVIGMGTSGSYTNVVICDGGATGWMWTSYLGNATVIPVDTPGAIDSIITPTKEREQLFRVVTLRQTIGSIYFEADHIFYDLSKHITHYKATTEVAASQACAGILDQVVNKTSHPHGFTISTDSNATQPKLDYQGQSVVKSLLDPSEGVAEKYGLEIVRDNYDIGMLTAAGTNRGGVIEHGVNAISLTVTRNTTNLYTRVIPYGKKADGNKLYLHDTSFDLITVTSPLASTYPDGLGGYMLLDCTEDAAVSNTMTVAQARAKMVEMANEQFSKYHVDEPEYEIKAQHINLGDTEEYPEYAGLDRLYLYDIVNVRYKEIGLNVNAEVTRITYNCLTNRVESLELSSVVKASPYRVLPSWEIPVGLTGENLGMGSIGFERLAPDTRVYRGESAPSDPLDGMVWLDTSQNAWKRWDSTAGGGAGAWIGSGVHTAYISVGDDSIDIGASGQLNIDAGQFNVRTSEFSFALVSSDGTEIYLGIDASGNVIARGLYASNISEQIFQALHLYSSEIGGMAGLANNIENTTARHVIYHVESDDLQDYVVLSEFSGSLEIVADTDGDRYRIPQLIFDPSLCGSVLIKHVTISMMNTNYAQTSGAITAYNASVNLTDCWIVNGTYNALYAYQNAVIGWSMPNQVAGGCTITGTFATTMECGEIKYEGYIPGGNRESGGFIYDNGYTVNPSSGPTPPGPSTQTESYRVTQTAQWEIRGESHNLLSTNFDFSQGTNNRGVRFMAVLMLPTGIREHYADAVSLTLQLTCMSSNYPTFTVKAYASNASSASSFPGDDMQLVATGTFSGGTGVKNTIDLTDAIGSLNANGCIVLYADQTSVYPDPNFASFYMVNGADSDKPVFGVTYNT